MTRRQTKYIVVHCSATNPINDIGADEIDQWHRQRGWNGIGYHAVIRRGGLVEFGRHFNDPGAHVKGHNFQSVGVCVVGGIDAGGNSEDNFTDAQYTSLYDVLRMLKQAYPAAEVLGHRDLSPDVDGDGVVEEHEWLKDCPCFDVRSWWRRNVE